MAWAARAQALYMLILAGSAAASSFDLTLNEGDTLSAVIVTGINANVPCYLKTPQGDVIEFRPENQSTNRIKYIETEIVSYCGANITNLTEEDEGEWTIYYITDSKQISNTYYLTISKAGNESVEESTSNGVENDVREEDIIEWLRVINISSRTGLTVDISLGKKDLDSSQEETFTIITPDEEIIQLDNVNMPGVTVHGGSDFVASRVTIGPLIDSLLGRWTLCGELNENRVLRRCQPVVISWNNLDNPIEEWNTTVLNTRNTVTNYLAMVNVTVRGSGSLLTCHLITPNGEDLILSSDSTYPGLTFVTVRDSALCTVTLGPIHKQFIGDWTLYASFFASRGGRNEVHLPFNLFLYDEEDPYSQAYNVTTLNPLTQMVKLGVRTTLTIPGKGTTHNCEIRSPSGESFDLQSSTDTVTFLATNSNVRCSVSIGPIGLETLGDWLFIAKYNYKGVFTESRQTVSMKLEKEEWLTDINISTRTGLSVDISLSKKELDSSLEEKFTITTPENEVLRLEDGVKPGVTVHGNSEFVDSRITIGPMDSSLLGRWILCGEVDVGVTVKRCQRVTISWSDLDNPSQEWNTTVLNKRDIVTNYLAIVNNTVRGSGALLTCHLITPDGEDLVLTSDSAFPGLNLVALRDNSICTVTMGPIHKQFIGEWILSASFYASRGGMNEVRLPFHLFLYDEEDPYSQAYNVTTLNPLTQMVHLGTSTTLTLSGSGTTNSCEIRSPSGELFDLQSSNDPVTFLSPDSNVRCRVSIGPIRMETLGDWLFIAKFNNRGVFTESRQTISLVLEEEEWLREISIKTRTGLTVDISLGKKELDTKEETFTLTTPNNEIIQLEDANIPGVRVHRSSEFVDSRVTIGPMDESLIGRWTLCGEVKVGAHVKRCQPVAISWNDIDNPSEEWNTTVLSNRETVTHYLATVNLTVRGSGALQNCHLITPEKEDLVLGSDAVFPGLAMIAVRDTAICSVTVGPIQKQFIGDWILYATFQASRGGMNEVRLPVHLFVYDEDNPYSQAYNVTTMNTITRVINLGSSLSFALSGSGTTDSCDVRSPSGQSYNLQNATAPVTFLSPDSSVRCRVSLGPFEKENLGDWIFIAKFNNRGIFTEIRQPISVLLEDPENPIIEDHRTIMLRDMIYLKTYVGAEHTIFADPNMSSRDITESCHIRTPSGLQYTIMEGFDLPGIQIVENANNRCIINVNVESENFVGEWTLISREQRNSQPVEVRQPFTIFVEEYVDASVSQVTVTEGNDLHLRLENPTQYHDSCKIYDPRGTERTDGEVDASNVDTCGFIVRNVQHYDNGVWKIRYKSGITYTAEINVIVKDLWESTHGTIVLTYGSSVNKTLGPETAVYCKLTDPTQRVVFEGHGRCNLVLDRVTDDHDGKWLMNVALLGNMLTRSYEINIEVREAGAKPIVTTFVAKEQPEVTLKCSVPVEYEVQSCLFQDPSGRVIIVNHGVAEDGYVSQGSGTTVDGNVTTHECGIRITNPVTADLGIWRCAVETDHEVYYGFLTVLCPWVMQDPATADAVVSKPILKPRQEVVAILEGDKLAMTCSILSPIRYCYFRRPDGVTYSVFPGISSHEYEYVGAGLDAGECGIRFSRLPPQKSGHWPEGPDGRWTCNVGLPNGTQPEQNATMHVFVERPIIVNHFFHEDDVYVELDVFNQQALEYCRYVRIDGLGFTSEALPDKRYLSSEKLNRGHCQIIIKNPTILDFHPWTVAAKIIGKKEELVGFSNHTLPLPIPEFKPTPATSTEFVTTPDISPEPETTPDISPAPETATSNNDFWLWCALFISGTLLIVSILLIPAKNRRNVVARATTWRDSFRSSLTKKPLVSDGPVGAGSCTMTGCTVNICSNYSQLGKPIERTCC